MNTQDEVKLENEDESQDGKLTTPRLYHIKLQGFTRNKLNTMMKYYGCTASEMFRTCINGYFGSQYRKETIGYNQGMNIYADGVERKGKKAQRETIIEDIKNMTYDKLNIYLHEIGFLPPDKPLNENDPSIFLCHRITYRHGMEGELITNQPPVYEQQHVNLDGTIVYFRMIYEVDEIIKELIKEKYI